MKTRIFIATTDGYIFDNGKLVAYEFKSAKIDFESGSVEYDCILGGKPTTFKQYNGDCPLVYEDENAYKRGEDVEQREYTWSTAISKCFWGVRSKVDDEERVDAYRIENGQIVETALPVRGYMLTRDGFKYGGKEKFYKTCEEASLYCDVIKVDADGNETLIKSPASLVALDEEQKKAVKAVERALKKASEMGVKFVCDTDYLRMYAYSGNNVADRNYDGNYGKFVTNDGYCINELMTKMDVAEIDAFNYDDVSLFVKFK